MKNLFKYGIYVTIVLVLLNGYGMAQTIGSGDGTDDPDSMFQTHLSGFPDGIYKGQYPDYDGQVCKVEVTIKGHRITDVKVLGERDDLYFKIANQVIGRILEEQSLEVDAVTGATVTSYAIIGAIRNALSPHEDK